MLCLCQLIKGFNMDRLTLAKMIMKHQAINVNDLPEYLFTDKAKDYKLEDEDDRILAHYNEDTLWSLKTVRFLKDFSRLGAGFDLDTTNRSFVRTAELFRLMGIKNYYFHLQLNNPMLKGVDPFAEDLPDELQFMVMNECYGNIWYIIREIVKIDGRRFIGNRAVISFIWSCLNHLNTLILLPRQSGKESWNSSVIKIPGGWKFIGDVKEGDIVINPEGKEVVVNAVYPNGYKPVYEVMFEDGGKHEAGGEHLWKVYDSLLGEWKVDSTLHWLDRYYDNKEVKGRLYVPIAKPEDGEGKNFIVPPYMLGTLLSKEKIKAFNSYRPTRQDQWLKSYTLLKRTCESYFIPVDYKLTRSLKQRQELLQGLMDHVGVVNKKTGEITLRVYNKRMAEDVQYLARSIGLLAGIEEELYEDTLEYIVNFRGVDRSVLFTDEKRIAKVKELDKKYPHNGMREITSFRLMNERKECTCIELDDDDHFIVTHNTVGMQVLIFILQYIVGRGYKSGLITLASSNRQQFVNAVKKIRSGVPQYLINMSYMDKDSGNLLTYQGYGEENKNMFEIRVPSGGEDGAENAARGATLGTLLLDEPAWMKWVANVISGSGPATLTEQKNMLEKGMPWFKASATTPNSVLKEEGRYMYGVYRDSTEWRENFFDSFSESHLFERVIKASPVKTTFPSITMQYNHLQLGFGDNWVKETMDKLNLSWSKAKIDLLMMWTEEGKNKIFDDKTRELLQEGKVTHVRHEEVKGTGLFIDWFITKKELMDFNADSSEFFTIGCDTSDAKGVENDACTVTITRAKTGEVIGTGRYSLAFLGDVRDVLLHLLIIIPKSVLIIERNRAQQIIDELLLILPAKGIDPFTRMYNEIYHKPVENAIGFRDVQNTRFAARTKEFYLRFKSKFGFQTNGTSRAVLYGLVFEAVNNTGALCRYGLLIDELIGLESGANGRIDHAVKGHDDIVISWLLGYFFLKLGYNKPLYGFPPNGAFTHIKTLAESKGNPKYTPQQLAEFALIRDKVNELTQRLLNCESDFLIARIESDLRKLTAKLPQELKRIITIDEVIEKAKQDRNKRRIDRKRRQFA